MKKFSGSIVVGLLLSSFALAGGDIAPQEPAVVMPPVVDDSGFYIGGAYSYINAETDAYRAYGYDIDIDPVFWSRETSDSDTSGFMLQLGYQFNKYIAVEGRYWNGGTNMDGTYTNSGMEGITDSWSDDCTDLTAWGIYVKPMFPVTDAVSIYGLLGYGNTQINDEWYGDGTELLDDNGFQWGVGLSYAYDEHISFFVDYVRLANDEGGSYDYNAGDIDPTYDYDYVNWDASVYTVNFGVTYKF